MITNNWKIIQKLFGSVVVGNLNWQRLRGSHNTNDMAFFSSHVIRIEPLPVQIPKGRFTTLVILIVFLNNDVTRKIETSTHVYFDIS